MRNVAARKYYAHSYNGVPAHELRDHLIDTASKAERRVKRIGLTGRGMPLGLGHDIGKYSETFNAALRAARNLARLYGHAGTLLAYSALGHHGGLPNGEDATDSCLTARLRRTDIPDASAWETDVRPSPFWRAGSTSVRLASRLTPT